MSGALAYCRAVIVEPQNVKHRRSVLTKVPGGAGSQLVSDGVVGNTLDGVIMAMDTHINQII